MSNDINIDIGSAVPYLIEIVKNWFGKDSLSNDIEDRFRDLFVFNTQEVSHIHFVGMWKPIPLESIYQPTKLIDTPLPSIDFFEDFDEISGQNGSLNKKERGISPESFVSLNKSAIIIGPPGCGKTVLMQWFFRLIVQKNKHLPILITLRRPKSIEILETCIKDFSHIIRVKTNDKKKVILLVDGSHFQHPIWGKANKLIITVYQIVKHHN